MFISAARYPNEQYIYIFIDFVALKNTYFWFNSNKSKIGRKVQIRDKVNYNPNTVSELNEAYNDIDVELW